MNIIIVSPELNRTGGVANFYRMLSPYFNKETVTFFFFGGSGTFFSKCLHRFIDPMRFITFFSTHKKTDVVLLNPSLGVSAFFRDAFFIFILTYIFQINTLVFWHGWDNTFANRIKTNSFLQWIFKKTFAKAQLMFVLKNDFKDYLIKWGFQKEIIKGTTAFEDAILSEDYSSYQKEKSIDFHFLFMARIEPDKGAKTAIDAFDLFQQNNRGIFRLTVAGNGSQLATLIKYVQEKGIKNVIFPGYVRGQDKIKLLKTSDCYLFPSSHGEGLPCSVLEAMAAGLPIITSACGAIPDFFLQKQMGIMLDDISAVSLQKAMKEIIGLPNLKAISSFNQQYASNNFSASNTASFLENIMKKYSSPC